MAEAAVDGAAAAAESGVGGSGRRRRRQWLKEAAVDGSGGRERQQQRPEAVAVAATSGVKAAVVKNYLLNIGLQEGVVGYCSLLLPKVLWC